MNKDFVAVEHNVTDKGFPQDLPALKAWEAAFKKDPRNWFGFATSVVVTPDGRFALGTSGCGHQWEADTAINYHPDKYLKFLEGSLDRHKRLRATDSEPDAATKAAALQELRGEILRQLAEANRCRKPAKR